MPPGDGLDVHEHHRERGGTVACPRVVSLQVDGEVFDNRQRLFEYHTFQLMKVKGLAHKSDGTDLPEANSAVPGAPAGDMADVAACVPSGAPGGWCVHSVTNCAARCDLEVEYAAAQVRDDGVSVASDTPVSFKASLTVVNHAGSDSTLRAWQATWAFATGVGVARDAVFATDAAVLVSPGGPGGQPARLVNALGDSGAVPASGGRKTFAFPLGVAFGTPFPGQAIHDVTLNGASCSVLGASLDGGLSPNQGGGNETHTGGCVLPSATVWRFCCGEEIKGIETLGENVSETSSSGFPAFVIVAVVLAVLCVALIARLVLKRRETDFTKRKTTRLLPGQVIASSGVDAEGAVVAKASSSCFRTATRPLTDGSLAPSPSPASLRSDRDTDDENDVYGEGEDDEVSDEDDPTCEIPQVSLHQIELGATLGQGAYGVVRAGVWRKMENDSEGTVGTTRRECENDSDVLEGTETQSEGCGGVLEGPRMNSLPVAVKTLHGASPSRRALRAFAREVSVLSRLKHPHIVRLLGACLTPPSVCIVEELVAGGSLFAYLHDRGTSGAGVEKNAKKQKHPTSNLTLAQTVDVCGDVASAMAYLARNGVVHRDLKTQNVLLVLSCGTKRIRAKVCDFGIAKALCASGNSRTQGTCWGFP